MSVFTTVTPPQLASWLRNYSIGTLRELEGAGKRIPAIALTGYAGVLDESKALDAGYELHFSKPINLTELANAIARLAGK